MGGLDVNLRREVALGVHLVVHVERSVLGIAEILFSVGLVDSERNGLLILEAGPNLLALFAMNDGRSGVLTERKLSL